MGIFKRKKTTNSYEYRSGLQCALMQGSFSIYIVCSNVLYISVQSSIHSGTYLAYVEQAQFNVRRRVKASANPSDLQRGRKGKASAIHSTKRV